MRKQTAGIIRFAHAHTGSTSRTPALLLVPEKTNCVDALALEACDLQHSMHLDLLSLLSEYIYQQLR